MRLLRDSVPRNDKQKDGLAMIIEILRGVYPERREEILLRLRRIQNDRKRRAQNDIRKTL
ncbi:MAG TPA: hypothetical protein ACFYD6_09470 [Candidatus Brocadiia bacterium]